MSTAPLTALADPDPGDDGGACPDLADLSPAQLLAVVAGGLGAGAGVFAGLGQLAAIDRLASWLAARKLSVVTALAPSADLEDLSWTDRNSFYEELQIACRVGEGTARRLIDTAALSGPGGPFAPMHSALAGGEVFEGHLRVLVSGTVNVVDDPPAVDPQVGPGRSREEKLAEICARVLDRASTETVGKFTDTVSAAVCAVDGEAEAARRAAARDTRDVFLARADADGMGALVTRNTSHVLAGVKTELDRQARVLQRERGGATAARTDPAARIGACRADVLSAAILGTRTPDSAEPVTWPLVAHLVIDLPTLRREADHPCTLDGVQVPAETGRDLAGQAKAWRRMVTDPVTGHLLDYGRLTYLPEAFTGPPLPSVREAVGDIRARDGVCPAPYCTRPSTRCQVDHRIPWDDHGPSNTINCGLLCDRHHPLKTQGHLRVSNSRADGSFDYTTAWGQSLHIPPRPYLDNPARYHPDRDETHARGTDPPADGPDGVRIQTGQPDPCTDPDPPPRLRLVQPTDNAEPALPRYQGADDSDPPF